MKKNEFIGYRFERLVVLSEAVNRPDPKRRFFDARCDCGTVKAVRGADIRSGKIKSCGCLQAENRMTSSVTHGALCKSKIPADARPRVAWRPPEYEAWVAMKVRCGNPRDKRFAHYGGRGITVCDRWRNGDGKLTGFECFLLDMGPRPSNEHSIDRFPDNDGNYEKDNCRWATTLDQGWSRRGDRHHSRRNAAKEDVVR